MQRIMTGPGGTTPIPQTAETPEVLAVLEAGTPPAPMALPQGTPWGPAREAADDNPQPHPLEAASAGVPADVKPMNSASMFRGRRLADEGGSLADAVLRAAARSLGIKPQVVTLGDEAPFFVETDANGFANLNADSAPRETAAKPLVQPVGQPQVVTFGDEAPYFVNTDAKGFTSFDTAEVRETAANPGLQEAARAQVVSLGDDAPYLVETDSRGIASLGDAGNVLRESSIVDSLRDIWSRIGVTLSRMWGTAELPQAEDGADSLLAA